jgi:hypothetical protein
VQNFATPRSLSNVANQRYERMSSSSLGLRWEGTCVVSYTVPWRCTLPWICDFLADELRPGDGNGGGESLQAVSFDSLTPPG